MLGFYPLASAPIADDANVSVSVTLSGVQATGQLGTAAVYAEAIVSPTGVQGTGAVGSVAVEAAANVLVTGVAATGNTGVSHR
jgi:hypothetical protein